MREHPRPRKKTPAARPSIPKPVAEEVLFRSQMRCCVCGERGDQIHHIDSDPTNNQIENLVFLCFKDHNDASVKGALQRKLTPELLRKFRDDLHERVKIERRPKISGSLGPEPSDAALSHFQQSMDALIVLETRKAFLAGSRDDWSRTEEVLFGLHAYVDLAGTPARLAILEELRNTAEQTRFWMPTSVAQQIAYLAYDFLPIHSLRRKEPSQVEESQFPLFVTAIHIADDIIYDGAVKLNDLEVVFYASKLLWQIHQFSRLNEITSLLEKLEETYKWLFSTLNRPGLQNSVQLVRVFYDQVMMGNPEMPEIPSHLEQEIFNSKRRARHGS